MRQRKGRHLECEQPRVVPAVDALVYPRRKPPRSTVKRLARPYKRRHREQILTVESTEGIEPPRAGRGII
jgi:hypothetical protein